MLGGLGLLSLSACGANGYVFGGSDVWEMFPFDGEREWHYVVDTDDLDYKLIGLSSGEPEVLKGKNVYTVDYTKDCVSSTGDCLSGDRLFQLRFSSDSADGVLVHAFDTGDGFVDFNPPVVLTEKSAVRDDVFETQSSGMNWTSTYLGIQECPIRMSADWSECGAFEVTNDTDPANPLVGTWWAVAGSGIAAFMPGEGPSRWELSSFDCTGECDGTW
jgi:hypothetical protein